MSARKAAQGYFISGAPSDIRQIMVIGRSFCRAREYVLCLRKYGYEIRELGEANRIAKRLQLLGIKPEQLELFLDKVAEDAFKRGLEPKVLIERAIETSRLSEKTKVPVEDLPSFIEEKRTELFSLNMDIMFKKFELDKAQQRLNVI